MKKYYAPTKLSDNIRETPEGYLLCIAVPIARTGEMEYAKGETPIEVGPSGLAIIDREEDEVFSAKTIASFEGKPLTIEHPSDFVDPTNWKDLAEGTIQNVRRGSGDQSQDLIADILISGQKAISLVKRGFRGLSCGYEAEYIQTGEGRGKQVNIIGNHLALVEEGRAGEKYQIQDTKGVFSMSKKFADKIKAAFSKVIDESVAQEEKSLDAEKKETEGTPAVMDELVKVCNAMNEFMKNMAPKAKDEEVKKDDEKKAADEEVAPGLEDRLSKLEAAVAKLLERESKEDEVPVVEDEDGEEMEDEDSEQAEGMATGDEKSMAEILAPGIAVTKDLKATALKTFYATKDGKAVVEALNFGKAPAFDVQDNVDRLFVACTEVVKAKRSNQLAKTKTVDFQSAIFDTDSAMTAEKMNARNAEFYKQK